MENIITAQILGARRGEVDGNKYAALYVMQAADPSDRNSLGMVPMKMACPFGLLDTLEPKALPGEFEIKVNMKPAGGGKVGFEAIACKPVKSNTAPKA